MARSLYHRNQGKNQSKKNTLHQEAKKKMVLADNAVTQVYDYAMKDAEEALELMGFGPIRIARFKEKLLFVQQVKGLHRKDDPLVVQPRNEVPDGE
jgi:hypothetical protein